jgi:hypothetical protein
MRFEFRREDSLPVQAGDDLDPTYPHYAEDVAEFRRQGLRKREKTLRTRLDNRIALHQFTDVAVSPDLSVREQEKADCAAPRDFAEYDRLLGDTLAAVIENAGDPEPDDGGVQIAARFGMETREYSRLAWKTVFSPALHGRYSSAVHPFRFTFHWGIERMKSRYGVRE